MAVVRTQDSRTQDRAAFEAARGSDASKLYVSRDLPYLAPDSVVEKDGKSEFDVDLRLGPAWAKDWSGPSPRYYKVPEDGIVIPPGGTAIVEVDEELRVPNNRFGLVVPKARLAFTTGVYPFTTKVDPTYSGYLKITLHNYTSRARTLKRGDAVASLILYGTNYCIAEGDARSYDGRARAEESRRRVGSWLEQFAYSPMWSAVAGTAVGTIIATITTVIVQKS